jgi:hypothetical protein
VIGRGGRVVVVLAVAAMTTACGKAARVSEPAEATTASTAPVFAAPPADHLADGELQEGAARAFGVPLPRTLDVNASFVDVVYASGPMSVDALVRYFRARLQDGSLRAGPTVATFEHVKVRGQPGMDLLVKIAAAPGGVTVQLRDATPPPAPNLPDEPARWRQVGLTPDGRLADPAHLD